MDGLREVETLMEECDDNKISAIGCASKDLGANSSQYQEAMGMVMCLMTDTIQAIALDV